MLPVPLFPSFIGTFDRFLWQFLITPFGIQGCAVVPRLVPDKSQWEVRPFAKAQPVPLQCFDRTTGKVDLVLVRRMGFDLDNRSVKAHETCAFSIIAGARSKGQVDFDDVRACVWDRLDDPAFAERVGAALAARFREIVVDEAQDCNPADLAIVDWLRQSGIIVKVICDPNQSIYEFRGGVTDELLKFAGTFGLEDRLPMSGNFRSTPAICAAIVALRPPATRSNPDQPVGRYKTDLTPVYILSYGGRGVSSTIGSKFRELVQTLGIRLNDAPVLSSTRASAAKAIGQPTLERTNHMTLLLAEAAMNYHFAFAVGNRRDALIGLHRIILMAQGCIGTKGEYHRFVATQGLEDGRWRPDVIAIAKELRFDPPETTDQWLNRARGLLAPGFTGGSSIKQRLRTHSALATALARAPVDSPTARTIHSAKGMEFPAVCVVLTSSKVSGILNHLEGQNEMGAEEEARKVYVGASRAERLLTLAIPKAHAARLQALLAGAGCAIVLHEI